MKQLLSAEIRVAPEERDSVPAAICRAGSIGVRGRMYRSAGFSMIELMIVVAIIAVLVAIAYPSYVNYITKTHRVAAEGCLSEYANYMERYYTTNMSYKTALAGDGSANVLPTLDCRSPQQTGANYSYDLPSSSLSVSSYVIEATPINAQLTRDTKCGTLTLDQTGARTPTTDGCW